MNFFKRIWNKLFGHGSPFGSKRQPQHLTYDTTTDEKGDLTAAGKTARKRILTTELKEGDTYRLGPEATVTVGPEGLAGKAWITARVKASEAKRKAKFDKWWAEKRQRCIEIMMMSEQELKDSGVWAEAQAFIAENQRFIQMAEDQGLLPKKQDAPLPPSGMKSERTAEAFGELIKVAGNDRMSAAGLVGSDGRLKDANEETIAQYRIATGGDGK